MTNVDEPKAKTYRVILKTGDFGDFTNNNHFENYPEVLLSGVYGIVNAGGSNLPITPDSVLRIEELTDSDAGGENG